jgi:hypothetical protein
VVFLARGQDGASRLHVRLIARDPFFSPDGQWLAFAADGVLKKMLIPGGTPVKICDIPDMRGASWGEDGNILFTPDSWRDLASLSAGSARRSGDAVHGGLHRQ